MGIVSRLNGVRARLAEAHCDAFVVMAVANVTYLTGFVDVWDDEPFSLVVITPDDARVFTDSRYREAAVRAAGTAPFHVVVPKSDLWGEVLTQLAEEGATCVAVESSLPFCVLDRARERFVGEVVPVDNWVEDLRQVKAPDEIENITLAQILTDRAFDHILGYLAEGVAERDIALELEFFMRREGSQGVAFAPIVAGGPNSALPHATPGDRKLAAGDFVVMDFGARVLGYCADMTRTVVIGHASDEQRAIYQAVLSANLAGIAAVQAGLPGSEIDAAARAVIENAGYAGRFGHGLGHGVGLEVHESPGVGPRSTEPIESGSVITIEPGVYIPEYGGVRIEDLVVVEASGAKVLTRSAKELIEL